MNEPITNVSYDGQPFVDIPQFKLVSKANPVALAVNRSFDGGDAFPSAVHELTHYEHTKLEWMKPDGKGGLVRKYK